MKILGVEITASLLSCNVIDGELDFTYHISRNAFEEFMQGETGKYTMQEYYEASREINDSPLHENLKQFINQKGEVLKYNREKSYAQFLLLCTSIEDDELRNQIIEKEREVRKAIRARQQYLAA